MSLPSFHLTSRLLRPLLTAAFLAVVTEYAHRVEAVRASVFPGGLRGWVQTSHPTAEMFVSRCHLTSGVLSFFHVGRGSPGVLLVAFDV